MRSLMISVVAAATSSCVPVMLTMRPAGAEGQDTVYRDGTPVTSSIGTQSDVIIAPRAGVTGRHELSARVGFVLFVRNRGGARIDVSERDVVVTASEIPVPVIPATALESEIQTDAAWARVGNAVAAAAATLNTVDAGVTTYSGNVGGAHVSGASVNRGAQLQAQRRVAADAAAGASAIASVEQGRLGELRGAFQRNTLNPGESVGGYILVERPWQGACSWRSGYSVQCRFVVRVSVGGDAHVFTFDEAL